ncbi:putative RNA polymerase II subunit B1 CTD phosphatase RPAP2 isoform X2 [Pseudophryne corroboree]|uniref:putative RNA polymerase II subunit B1 CTD phosphatase RPAP2 isoform X2 n=1 Tax=Pseudophryne corroboree TaxID=495146 RepID=UPI0030820100
MAERGNTGKARKSPRKSPGNVPASELSSEDIAKRRAALERAIRRKVDTEKRAHLIVERLLENNITEDFLVDCAKFISPSHYKDTVEERSITWLCGYPICNNRLEKVSKQKYKISTTSNKVYDITERKCFCSNFCYRASKYYEAQIPATPVWTREGESPPVITLLKEGKRGHSGEEVKLIESGIKTAEIEKPKSRTEEGNSSSAESDADQEPEQTFVSSLIPETQPSPEDTEPLQGNGHVTQTRKTPDLVDINQNLPETTERLEHCKLNEHESTFDLLSGSAEQSSIDVTKDRIETAESSEATYVDVMEVTQRSVSKSGAERLRELLCKSRNSQTTQKDSAQPVTVKNSMLEVVTQTLNEWKSEYTLQYLFGTNYMAEATIPKQVVSLASNQIEDLDEDDLRLDANDINALGASDNAARLNECLPYQNVNDVSKPIPDYSKIREESKALECRVTEFFRGHYILPEEVQNQQTEETKIGLKKGEASWVPALPLVDSCSQQQIRKKIILEKLKRVLPAILAQLQIPYSDVSKELHNLVKTFRFTSKNITHTTPEWSIIAIVLLSVILPTMPLHKDSQQSPLYTQFIAKLLQELHLQGEDLECLKSSFASNMLPLSTM